MTILTTILFRSARRLASSARHLTRFGPKVIPLALVFNSVNPILAQGAAFGEVTMLAGFDGDITALVPNGATLELDPASRSLRVR